MIKNSLIAAFALAMALAGCSGSKDKPNVAETSEASALSSSDPETGAAVNQASVALEHSIPEGIRGRWGLVPADCTSTAGDAKGLLTIGATQLKFYESIARLGEVKSRESSSVTATFDFSGEGQNWVLDVTLSSPDGGKTLVRKDTGPDAAPEPLTYTRCP